MSRWGLTAEEKDFLLTGLGIALIFIGTLTALVYWWRA